MLIESRSLQKAKVKNLKKYLSLLLLFFYLAGIVFAQPEEEKKFAVGILFQDVFMNKMLTKKMTIWIILAGIIAPAFFWIGYFYYKDQAQPEPFLKIGTAYLLGLLTAYACLPFYSLLPLLRIP